LGDVSSEHGSKSGALRRRFDFGRASLSLLLAGRFPALSVNHRPKVPLSGLVTSRKGISQSSRIG
jgi:hypothetical protein